MLIKENSNLNMINKFAFHNFKIYQHCDITKKKITVLNLTKKVCLCYLKCRTLTDLKLNDDMLEVRKSIIHR